MQLITETSRLKLVEVTGHDINLIYLLTENEKVMELFPSVLSYDDTLKMVQNILHQYAEYGYCFWKVLLKPDDHFVGIAGLLHQVVDNEIETEISYRIFPEHWKNGYATEAAKVCKEYAETKLGKKRLISLIHPKNKASKRVVQKPGSKKTKSVVFMGVKHEVYLYKHRRIA